MNSISFINYIFIKMNQQKHYSFPKIKEITKVDTKKNYFHFFMQVHFKNVPEIVFSVFINQIPIK